MSGSRVHLDRQDREVVWRHLGFRVSRNLLFLFLEIWGLPKDSVCEAHTHLFALSFSKSGPVIYPDPDRRTP